MLYWPENRHWIKVNMKSKKEVSATKKAQSWDSYSNSEKGRESANWTTVQRCLDGTATEEEYCSLDRDYASYGHDGLRVVGPGCGPIHIPDSPEARARFAEMVYESELEARGLA